MSSVYLQKAREETSRRFELLHSQLVDAESLVTGRACVYATGSFGRLEAGPHSDLDLFIVVDVKESDGELKRLLDGIDEIKLKFHLIAAVENTGITKFDAGGRYLESHSMNDFVAALGSQTDDFKNTLTGRLLLLLESKPLIGSALYSQLLSNVIDAYFRDYAGNETRFIPSFLINDILRLWRTFCVNYEFSRRKGSDDIKIKNLKLKFSRMMTCYSAIIHLLATHISTGTISPDDVRNLVRLTPTERIANLKDIDCPISGSSSERFSLLIDQVLDEYSSFLELTHKPKSDLLSAFQANPEQWKQSSYKFGTSFAEALSLLGNSTGVFNSLYRMILI